MKILVTGGAGYIGSHTLIELLNEGYEVLVVDNLVNSSLEAIKRVEKITGKKIQFENVDLLDITALEEVFKSNEIDSVIHFAGLKAVGESVEKPLMYYENNVSGSINLFKLMVKYEVSKIVFSSSATVYGNPEKCPISETAKLGAESPYGRTKLMIEQILEDVTNAHGWNTVILRYFNPVGAHETGLIGEDPKYPNNLLPYITQVAVGIREKLMVFGDDYNTVDGTGVRDYIHVVDLAKGHIKALEKVDDASGYFVYNLGSGTGISVLEMHAAMEKTVGKKIPYKITDRRSGDVPTVVADPSKANVELGWKTKLSLDEICESAWKWQSMNPEGYTVK